MKKLLIVMLLMIGAAEFASAQVCKISGSNDNIEVFSAEIELPNKVVATVSNDSQEISANVTVTVEVSYNGGRTKKTFSGKGLAKPNQSTPIDIKIDETVNGYKAESVKAVGISGTKCL